MANLYVSKLGTDNNNGSEKSPFLTLQRAVDEAKKGGIDTIYIREGVYSLNHSVVIDKIDNLEIKAYSGENVRLIGGVVIDTADVKVADNEKIDANVMGKVLSFKLPDEVRAGNIDFSFGKDVEIPAELFIDGKVLEIARFPKNDYIPITEVLDEGACHIDGDYSLRGGTFRCTNAHINRWADSNDVWMYGFFGAGFAAEYLKVKSIDINEQTITVDKNARFGLNTKSTYRDFYVLNVLRELTSEGEYYLDRGNNTVYFYPPSGYSENSEIVVSVINEPLITINACTNVRVSNLTLEMSRLNGVQIFSGENNTINNCTIKNMGQYGVVFGIGESCVEPDFSSAKDIPYNDRNFWENDRSLLNRYNLFAGENNIVENCEIVDCGTGGIQLRGGYRPSLRSGNNKVHNCKLHHCDRWIRCYRPVIRIEGVGNTVSNCEIYDADSIGIWLYGNEHVIEYNDFHDLCKDVDDSGAFYMGRNPSERGNIIRYNYFHHIISRREIETPIADGFGVFSVYADDGASGNTIFGNVFYRGGNWAIANNGGSYMNVSNNIIIQSQSCIWHTNNLQGWYTLDNMPQKEELRDCHGHFYYDKLCDAVNVLQPPYSEKYPELKFIFEEGGYPQNNRAENNVCYRCLNFLTMWHEKDMLMVNGAKLKKDGESEFDMLKRSKPWYEEYNNIFTSELNSLDGFENGNIDFEAINAEIKSRNNNFEPIPWENIGYKEQVQ